jgi:hypothetical protein
LYWKVPGVDGIFFMKIKRFPPFQPAERGGRAAVG